MNDTKDAREKRVALSRWLAALSIAVLLAAAVACSPLDLGTEPAAPPPDEPTAPPSGPTPFPVAVTASPATAISDTEALVLRQVGQEMPMCPFFAYDRNTLYISTEESPARFSLVCGVGWGHVSDVRIWRYDSAADAESALADQRGDQPPESFHGHPAVTWRCLAESYANCDPDSEREQGMLHRNHCWQADRWLVCAHAFDDTSIESALDPLEISEAVHGWCIEQGLIDEQ